MRCIKIEAFFVKTELVEKQALYTQGLASDWVFSNLSIC
jgi:hypothetical protein